MELFQRIQSDRGLQLLLAFCASVLLHAWSFLGTVYSADKWALREDRHKALKAVAWAAGLPLRLLFSLFSGFVATLVWALLLGAVYVVWRVVNG